jgi:uncharacterized protein
MSDLNQAAYISLATFRKTGETVATPVWFAAEGDRYFVFSNGNAGKVKRLRNSSRARLAACDVRGKLLGEWHEAQAVLIDDADNIRHAHAALLRKYGWQMAMLDFFAGLFGRKKQRAFIEVRLTGASV